MRVPLLDLKAQYHKLKPALDEAALRVLASGRHVMGPELEAFEKELATYLQLPYAVGVASGTDALLSAAMALCIGPGDDVVTPAYSFFATPETAVRLGARPVFCDIEEDGFNADINDFLTQGLSRSQKLAEKNALVPLPDETQATEQAWLDGSSEPDIIFYDSGSTSNANSGKSGNSGSTDGSGTTGE